MLYTLLGICKNKKSNGNKMNIEEVILKLEEYKKQHGNIKVRVAGAVEYWGTTYNEVDEFILRVDENTSCNPKKMENAKAVVFCFGYDS